MITYIKRKCNACNIFFKISASNDKSSTNKKVKNRYCSKKCFYKGNAKIIKLNCSFCKKIIIKSQYLMKRSKTNLFFCNHSCSTSYNNINKKFGYRRSKLEIWLEEQLIKNYPQLKITFNNKQIINSELDIYIPNLKLAFELNGIFHYEPIYGPEKLQSVKNNDNRKFQACLEHDIELCIIDTSSFGYFKIDKAEKYLHIITNIINNKISNGKSGN